MTKDDYIRDKLAWFEGLRDTHPGGSSGADVDMISAHFDQGYYIPVMPWQLTGGYTDG